MQALTIWISTWDPYWSHMGLPSRFHISSTFTMDTAIFQSLRSRKLTSVSPFFLMDITRRECNGVHIIHILILVFLLVSSFYLHFQHCSCNIATISTYYMSIPAYSRFHTRRVVAFLISSFLILYSVRRTLCMYPLQHSHFRLIHQPSILLFSLSCASNIDI